MGVSTPRRGSVQKVPKKYIESGFPPGRWKGGGAMPEKCGEPQNPWKRRNPHDFQVILFLILVTVVFFSQPIFRENVRDRQNGFIFLPQVPRIGMKIQNI